MSNANNVLLCYCTCPNAASAQHLADALIGESLAACVNRIPGIHSTYRWKGDVTTDTEELLLIKTTASAFEKVSQKILEVHSYDLPECIQIAIEAGSAEYLKWIAENVK